MGDPNIETNPHPRSRSTGLMRPIRRYCFGPIRTVRFSGPSRDREAGWSWVNTNPAVLTWRPDQRPVQKHGFNVRLIHQLSPGSRSIATNNSLRHTVRVGETTHSQRTEMSPSVSKHEYKTRHRNIYLFLHGQIYRHNVTRGTPLLTTNNTVPT
jgi:hypothetical protein